MNLDALKPACLDLSFLDFEEVESLGELSPINEEIIEVVTAYEHIEVIEDSTHDTLRTFPWSLEVTIVEVDETIEVISPIRI